MTNTQFFDLTIDLLDRVHNFSCDQAIVPHLTFDLEYWTPEEVAYMKNHDKPKKLFAKIVADEIVPSSWYWKREWKSKKPNWWPTVGRNIITLLISNGFDGIYIETNKYDIEINSLIKSSGHEFIILHKKEPEVKSEIKSKTDKSIK